MIYTYENWLNGEVEIKDKHFLISSFSPADRERIKEESKQIILRESSRIAKKMYDLATNEQNAPNLPETLEFNKKALEEFSRHSEFADLEKGVIDCFLKTPKFIEQTNFYFPILSTHKLIKLLEQS